LVLVVADRRRRTGRALPPVLSGGERRKTDLFGTAHVRPYTEQGWIVLERPNYPFMLALETLPNHRSAWPPDVSLAAYDLVRCGRPIYSEA